MGDRGANCSRGKRVFLHGSNPPKSPGAFSLYIKQQDGAADISPPFSADARIHGDKLPLLAT